MKNSERRGSAGIHKGDGCGNDGETGVRISGTQHENELYHLFVLRSEVKLSLRHIYCYDKVEPEFMQLTGFRDYLNEHPEAAEL